MAVSVEPRRLRVDAGGTELSVLEAGAAGRGRILVLHGFCGSKESFEEVATPLATGGWHVLVPDQRGHGESAHPAGGASYSFDLFVRDALALADEEGWDRFVVLGHSMGGMTALRLALARPERLDGLILMDTSHRRLELDPVLVDLGRQLVEKGGMAALNAALEALDPLATEAHRRLLAHRPGYQEMLDSQNLASSPEMWLAMSEEISDAPDLSTQLPSLSMPTLVVVGEQDEPFVGPSREIARSVPGARLEVIPDAGHSPQLEAREKWLEVVGGFLSRLASRLDLSS